ncbi:TonB-dependent receptor [Nguyenibacter vanlangensis]|uniref:TonB-dependent receptor n=2 Tax=Nguyenibacter vanlangensis TaxID=1216886 RepID=A0A7Y7M5S6_9PROT|nr:TonB-dependent receptor [Nguyenibacter vanlangensis]NVN09926.1 TonB-dependent receptor [Nguyenibacter vanlangensis]
MSLKKGLLFSASLAFSHMSVAGAAPEAASLGAHKRKHIVKVKPAPTPAARQGVATGAHAAPTGRRTVRSAVPAGSVAAPDAAEIVIATGTHVRNRTARASTSPIDVISAAALRRSGQINLADALARTNPSISINAVGWDAGALTSFIRLRGLNPNDTLVLVDGKRRHMTGNIYADSGPQKGSMPVDLNMIPVDAIDHIEVLRDGAAAQYGSDAIAGVVNVVLKKTPHGLDMTAQTGANAYNGDGWQYQVGMDGGFSLGGDGYLHLSGQAYHTDHFVHGGTDARTGLQDDQAQSTPEETRETLGIDFGKTLAEGVQGYGFITYGHRHAEANEHYRLPSVLPQLYPYGFLPLETIEENDYAATLGLKGDRFLGFHWDLSTTYGADEDDIGVKNTANVGFYDAYGWTPTTVHAESYRNAQWTNDLDFTRLFQVLGRKLNLAFGAEHRLETYDVGAGIPPSYLLGGTAAYAGLMPENAGRWSRDIWAGYIDTDMHVTRKLDVDLAGRFEHYTDFGNTENGKISARYDFTRRIAVRATISNGFRAPTLAEEHYSSLNVSPTGATGDLAVNSAAARLLGAVPLKPERSTNASGGIVLEPVDGFHVAVDVYQINIRDRIVAGGNYEGAIAEQAIALTGATLPTGLQSNDVSATYFSNGASTRTQGLDITADYLFRLRQYGNLDLSLGLNLNRTRLHHLAKDANGNPLLSAQGIGYLTNASPRSKIILDAYWTIGNWDINLRQTRYGQTVDDVSYEDQAPAALRYSNTQFYQFVNTPRWLTDLEVGYRLSRRWHVAVGANNIFNVRPRRMPLITSYLGNSYYDANSSGVPITGGYYYGRINFSL